MLSQQNSRLVDAATAALARSHRSEVHTVAAAAYDGAGTVFVGVNVFHFTGGPCAELVVIGQAAASGSARLPLAAMVAVRDQGVLAPCGRCRQVLFDLYPDIAVIVPLADGPGEVPVRSLLPHPPYERTIQPARERRQ